MHTNPKLASELIDAYNGVATKLNLTANEFIVYCAVIHCCTNAVAIKGAVGAVMMRDIQASLVMSRETVRRTLHHLEDMGLLKRIDDMWIYD